MFFTVTTPVGAIVGTVFGFLCSAWISIGAMIVSPVYPKLNVWTEFCNQTIERLAAHVLSHDFLERAIPADQLTGFDKFYSPSYSTLRLCNTYHFV